tara:strand:- start:53 stop:1135 length:1083 start_codon:yes stop_codon:yes gene_type:complete
MKFFVAILMLLSFNANAGITQSYVTDDSLLNNNSNIKSNNDTAEFIRNASEKKKSFSGDIKVNILKTSDISSVRRCTAFYFYKKKFKNSESYYYTLEGKQELSNLNTFMSYDEYLIKNNHFADTSINQHFSEIYHDIKKLDSSGEHQYISTIRRHCSQQIAKLKKQYPNVVIKNIIKPDAEIKVVIEGSTKPINKSYNKEQALLDAIKEGNPALNTTEKDTNLTADEKNYIMKELLELDGYNYKYISKMDSKKYYDSFLKCSVYANVKEKDKTLQTNLTRKDEIKIYLDLFRYTLLSVALSDNLNYTNQDSKIAAHILKASKSLQNRLSKESKKVYLNYINKELRSCNNDFNQFKEKYIN